MSLQNAHLTASERHDKVLAYLGREATREADRAQRTRLPEPEPLGGVTLDQYRTARQALHRLGLIRKTPKGRWVPA